MREGIQQDSLAEKSVPAGGRDGDGDKNPRASLYLSGDSLVVPETVFEVRSVSELVF